MNRKPILTDKRRDKLADYALNISVASFAVVAFGEKYRIAGIFCAILGIVVFFLLTKED